MNKAITDDLLFMPPKFRTGLDVWSSGDGTAGSDTYAGSGPGSFVSADANFAGCLEIVKTAATQPLRYMGVTPILPGCYLRVKARVKAVSGALPSVRIAGTPLVNGTPVGGMTTVGPATTLTALGVVTEIDAIIGTGVRNGVDMVWAKANGAHIGLDLTGATCSVVRVDDIEIEDVTNVFLRDMIGLVDVRDYGAVGDGTTDDSAAFEAADAAANGREVLVSRGTYLLGNHVTIQSQIRFEGTITQPANKRFIMQRNFDYATYLDAFGDEELAFRKAFQALLNYTDHESLDLGGRRIGLSGPIDMQAAEGTKTSFEVRRVIRNGMIEANENPNWDPVTATSQGTYSVSAPKTLTNVANVANIEVGSLVTGTGVGREVYVRDRNVAAQTVTLSQALFNAEGTQTFTFTRFKYMLDFSGFEKLSQFQMTDIEFQCYGRASGIMMAKNGFTFQLRDCAVTRPRDRALTSIGRACQDLMLDRCQFMSDEMNLPVQNRKSMVVNINANDSKIRDCRVVRFERFAVIAGTGHILTGNHWFHGDDQPNGVRKGGLVIANTNPQMMITGNYIDNNTIEWTNEYEYQPDAANQYSFGGLTITGNDFVVSNAASWFRWIAIKPFGPGHHVNGLTVTGNVFRTFSCRVDRIEHVDTTYATLDHTRNRNVTFWGNVFHGVETETQNPLHVEHRTGSAQTDWSISTGGKLPFGGYSKWVGNVGAAGVLTYGDGARCSEMPAVFGYQGAAQDGVKVNWSRPVSGTVRAQVRMDNPT